MILDLNGKILKQVSITLMPDDRVLNGILDSCVIRLTRLETDIKTCVPNGTHNCSITYERVTWANVIELADGTRSIAEIAKVLCLQHKSVKSIIEINKPEYFRLRAIHKLQQTLPGDLAILANSKKLGVLDACAQHNINPTSYRARVRKYKEYNLWPV